MGIDSSALYLIYDGYVRNKLSANPRLFLQAYLDWKESGNCYNVGPIEFVRIQDQELAAHIEMLTKLYDF